MHRKEPGWGEGFSGQGLEITESTSEKAARVFETDLIKKAQIVKQFEAKLD
jgi:hypothetical protein